MSVIANRIKAYEPPGGDGYRPDTDGDTIDAATPMNVWGSIQYISGVVERLTDADAYSFTTHGGAVVIDATPDKPSGVALKLSVYDANGTLLGIKDAPTNDQHLTIPLAAGTYYAILSSQGNYGDVGAYNLTVGTLPTDWDSRDIGSVGQPGYSGYDPDSGTFTIGGGGSDIWGTADQFRFAATPLTGDGSITVRVVSQDNTDGWAKAGVMIRETLASNSKHAMMVVSPDNGAAFQYRSSTGGSSFDSHTAGPAAPYWVQLVRSGDTLTGYYSSDGITWTQQSSATVAMKSTVYIGLAVTSHNNGTVSNAMFDNVALTGNIGTAPPVYNDLPAPTNLTLALGVSTGINLSWDPVDGSIGYAVDRSTDDVNWAQIATPGAGVTTFGDTGLAGEHDYFYRVSARDATGRSVPSTVADSFNRPSAPFNLMVSSVGNNNQFILNWRDVTGETGYRLERSTDGVNFTTVVTVGANVPAYTDNGISRFATYYYRVVATSTLGDSLASAVATNSIGLAPSGVAPDQVPLQWNAVSGAASYRVERSTNGGATFTALATVTGATTYTDTTVSPSTTYYYRVAGQNGSSQGVSPWQYVIVTTPAGQSPQVTPFPDHTIPSAQEVLTVSLSATGSGPITFTATAQSLAYVLTQQTGTLTYFSDGDNYYGQNEKWLQSVSGQWYFILATGELFQWDGGDGASGILLGNVGSSYYTDPSRLTDPPANDPHAALSISGNTLTVTRDLSWVSTLVITITATNAAGSDSTTFGVFVNP
jgi:hypothetical protein